MKTLNKYMGMAPYVHVLPPTAPPYTPALQPSVTHTVSSAPVDQRKHPASMAAFKGIPTDIVPPLHTGRWWSPYPLQCFLTTVLEGVLGQRRCQVFQF